MSFCLLVSSSSTVQKYSIHSRITITWSKQPQTKATNKLFFFFFSLLLFFKRKKACRCGAEGCWKDRLA